MHARQNRSVLPDSSRQLRPHGLKRDKAVNEKASVLTRIEPAVHIAAGLKGREHLLGDWDLAAVARVSSGARLARLDPEHTKAAQLNPISLR